MLSRVAENLYWLSRYVERAENLARLLDDAFHLDLDDAGMAVGYDGRSPVQTVLTILGHADAPEPPPDDPQAILRQLTFDRQHEQSILTMIARARENARGTQESLSAEAWSQVNRLFLYLSGPRAQRRFLASPFRFFESLKRACVLFAGLVDSTLPRTEVYHFLQVGRYLERVDMTSRIITSRSHAVTETGLANEQLLQTMHWASLLRSCSAQEAYLRSHRDQIEARGVVHYLILDPDFPRTIRFGVRRCLESLQELSGGLADSYGSEAERLLGRLEGQLRYTDIDEILERGLRPFLGEILEACGRIDRALRETCFLT